MRPALSALFLSLPLALAPLGASAQSLPALGDVSSGIPSLTLSLSPQFPQPYGSLTITPQSTLINLDTATISITVNGKPASVSGGSATITLPGPGVETDIEATATINGQSYTASASVEPAPEGSVTL